MKKNIVIIMLLVVFSCNAQKNVKSTKKDEIKKENTNPKSDLGGPPTIQQLIGFWKKVEIPNENEVNKVNPWPQKYQWFAFYENGKMYSMMTDKDYDYGPKELKVIFDVLPKNRTPNYKLNGLFLSIDNKDIKDYKETWGVNLLAKDVNNFVKKGMLIMSLDDGKGNAIYLRLLKKLND